MCAPLELETDVEIRPLAQRQHLLTLISGERAWRASGIFPKDSVSVQDLIPFQRPHSWHLGLGSWPQSIGVVTTSPPQLISCFLSSAKQHSLSNIWGYLTIRLHQTYWLYQILWSWIKLQKNSKCFVLAFCFCLFVCSLVCLGWMPGASLVYHTVKAI